MKQSPENSPDKREQMPPYREFERAVCDFMKALDPSATVFFNHKVPDCDTGALRQVDGWIEAKWMNHFPISILVSCKAHKRKVHAQEIGAFIDEVRSAGANLGVIYATSGFTPDAQKKVEANSLLCCRLYRKEPADIPQALFLWSYCCQAAFGISMLEAFPTNEVQTWRDLFESKIGNDPEAKSVLEWLEQEFRRQEGVATESIKTSRAIPSDWHFEYAIADPDNPPNRFVIRLAGHWRVFRSRLEAHLLNGSYCFQNQSFVGNVRGPSVDMASSDPGAGWEETTERELPRKCILIVRTGGGFKDAALAQYGPKPIWPSATP